tara:strand:+ start:1044 stop:1244 length:201 start_codon:yes stop_codon:yes gene_type:complete
MSLLNNINEEVYMSALALSPEERRQGERRKLWYWASQFSTGSEMIDKFNHKYAIRNRRQLKDRRNA